MPSHFSDIFERVWDQMGTDQFTVSARLRWPQLLNGLPRNQLALLLRELDAPCARHTSQCVSSCYEHLHFQAASERLAQEFRALPNIDAHRPVHHATAVDIQFWLECAATYRTAMCVAYRQMTSTKTD